MFFYKEGKFPNNPRKTSQASSSLPYGMRPFNDLLFHSCYSSLNICNLISTNLMIFFKCSII